MLRITQVDQSPSSVTLKVEGRIVSDWVPVLREETLRILQSGREAVLDFSDVSFVGPSGVRMLRKLGKRVRMINGSALVLDLLKKP